MKSPQIMQLHWQYRDGKTDMQAQREVSSNDEMRKFVSETNKTRPCPEGATWMACNELSKHFVGVLVHNEIR